MCKDVSTTMLQTLKLEGTTSACTSTYNYQWAPALTQAKIVMKRYFVNFARLPMNNIPAIGTRTSNVTHLLQTRTPYHKS
jgi:hypothetical protein